MKRIISLFLILTMTLTLAACGNKPPEEEDPNKLGNSEESSGEVYVDSATQQASFDQNDEEATDPDTGYDPISFATIDEIPEGTYCIEHTNADGTKIYYKPYAAQGTFLNNTPYTGATLEQPDRYVWTKIGLDETMIPTMYQGDRFIYKSNNEIADVFVVERFKDMGYTIGLAGLMEAPSGNYVFSTNYSSVQPYSDTVNIANLGAEDIFVVSVGTSKVSSNNVSSSGTIMGLSKDANYTCDIRTGTQQILAAFRANIHFYTSYETYLMNKFYFSDPTYIEIPFEKSMKTGYYNINNSGIFRFVNEADYTRRDNLTANDYNVPFMNVDINNYIISTVDGYSFENGYITRVDR